MASFTSDFTQKAHFWILTPSIQTSLLMCRSKLLIAIMMQSQRLVSTASYHVRPWYLSNFSSVLVGRKLSTGKSASRQLLAVAPMMGHTDCHQRYLQRLLSKKTVLYTEMVVAAALLRAGVSEPRMWADFELENPVVLQLGGNDAAEMKLAAKLAVSYGYQEINLNIGCPSEKVAGESGFGAALYLNPPLVAELTLAVYEATHKPATIKCRIGVNDHESYEELYHFIRLVSEVGKVEHFIVHARIAILDPEFTPKSNRNIPPLKYDVVYRLMQDFPHLKFTLNGGVPNMKTVQELLKDHPQLEGVMVGRAIMSNPFGWSRADSLLFKTKDPGLSRVDVLTKYARHCAKQEKKHDTHFSRTLIKPIYHLFHSRPPDIPFRKSLDHSMKTEHTAYDAIMFAVEKHVS